MEDRVLKTAAIRVQSVIGHTDPAYKVVSRIIEDITTVTASEARWKPGDPVDEAVAEIWRRINAALSPGKLSEPKEIVSAESPSRRRRSRTKVNKVPTTAPA